MGSWMWLCLNSQTQPSYEASFAIGIYPGGQPDLALSGYLDALGTNTRQPHAPHMRAFPAELLLFDNPARQQMAS